jgi:excisionase family DNA binding protein
MAQSVFQPGPPKWGRNPYRLDPMPDELLTVAQVAERLKLNQQTVRNWIDKGTLPGWTSPRSSGGTWLRWPEGRRRRLAGSPPTQNR